MKKQKFFYGWIMTVITFIGMGLINYLGVSSFALFVTPVVKTMGITATAFLLCATMISLGSAFGAMAGGKLLDEKGLRLTGTLSAVLMMAGFIVLRFAGSLLIFYICYFAIGFGAAATGVIFINKMVGRWFIRLRGTVTGICSAGQSTFTFLLSKIIAARIESSGYKSAYLLIAVILLGVAVMLALFVRERPQDIGQLPDGDAVQNADAQRVPDAVGMSAGEALKTKALWLILIAFGLNTMAGLGVIQTYNAHFQSVGYTALMAATAVSVYGLGGIFARILWGRIADIIPYKTVSLLGYIFLIGSLLFLASVRSAGSSLPLYVFGIAFAIGNGFPFVIMVKYLSDNFGTRAFGMLSGYTYTAMMLGSMAGIPMAGFFFDRTGSYSTAYIVFAVIDAISYALLLMVKKPKNK